MKRAPFLLAFLLGVLCTGCGSTVVQAGSSPTAARLDGGSGSGLSAPTARLGQPSFSLNDPNGGPSSSETVGPGSASDQVTGPAAAAPSLPAPTTKPVDVGFLVSDSGEAALKALGFSGVATGDPRNQVAALVHYVNTHGGLAGRSITPIFYSVNPADTPDQSAAAACATFTQDHRVFAVVQPLNMSPAFVKCLAKAGTIDVATYDAQSEATLSAVRGFYFDPPDFTLERFAREYINQLSQLGFFTPQGKIGLLTYDTPDNQALTEHVIKPALAAHGLRLTDVAAFDPTNYASQGQGFALRFKAEGITHVLNLATGTVVLFQQAAEQQQYRPRYALSSRDGPAAWVQVLAPAAQLRGSMGIGWQPTADVDINHSPGDVSPNQTLCRRIMRAAGENMNNSGPIVVSHRYCEGVFFLRVVAARAGALSAPQFAKTVAALGSAYPAVLTFKTFFTANRSDGPAEIRPFTFNNQCNCFIYSGPLQSVN